MILLLVEKKQTTKQNKQTKKQTTQQQQKKKENKQANTNNNNNNRRLLISKKCPYRTFKVNISPKLRSHSDARLSNNCKLSSFHLFGIAIRGICVCFTFLHGKVENAWPW